MMSKYRRRIGERRRAVPSAEAGVQRRGKVNIRLIACRLRAQTPPAEGQEECRTVSVEGVAAAVTAYAEGSWRATLLSTRLLSICFRATVAPKV